MGTAPLRRGRQGGCVAAESAPRRPRRGPLRRGPAGSPRAATSSAGPSELGRLAAAAPRAPGASGGPRAARAPGAPRAPGAARLLRLLAVGAAAGLLVAPARGDGPEDALVRWAVERGLSFGAKVKPGIDAKTGFRGLVAEEKVAKGAKLFEVPKGLVLTSDFVIAECGACQTCSGSGCAEGASEEQQLNPELLSPTQSAFAAFLLEQRAAPAGSAPFGPYVEALPKGAEGFPLTYSEQDLESLQASPLRYIFKLDQESLAADFATLRAALPSGTSLEDFAWARTMAKSRCFSLNSLSGKQLVRKVIAMVPFADLVNHPPDGLAEANAEPSYDPRTGALTFKAIRDIGANEGVYYDYGFKSNRASLMRYGFVSRGRVALTDMPFFFSVSGFPPGSPAQAKSNKMKLDYIAKARKEGSLVADDDGTVMHNLALSLSGEDAEKLLGHMRFMVLQPKTEAQLEETCPGTFCKPSSLANERQALQLLASRLKALLEKYNTSAAEDGDLLEQGKVTPADGAKYSGLVVRYGEKQVLRGYGRLLGALDPLFDLSPWALAKVVGEKWNKPDSDVHRYVQTTITDLLEAEGLRWAKRKVKEQKAAAAAGEKAEAG